MRAFQRTTLKVVLVLAPLMPTGCASWPHRHVASRGAEQRQVKLNTAQLEESRGHLEVAKTLYEEIRQQDPSNAECLHRLAVICTRMNQHNAAEVYFRQANALKPNDPEILADMGYAAFVNKKYAESEVFLEESVRIRDGDRRAITNLAIVRAWLGKDDASLETFRRVSSEGEAIRNLAAIQVARGDKEKARKNYDLAQHSDGKHPNNTNAVAQTGMNDKARHQVSDVPPPPAPLTPLADSSTQTATPTWQATSAPQAPLPPLPVISPNGPSVLTATTIPAAPEVLPTPDSIATPAAIAAPAPVHVSATLTAAASSCASAAIPPAPASANGPAAPLPPATTETSKTTPSANDAPVQSPVKDDYSTSLPAADDATASAAPQANESDPAGQLSEPLPPLDEEVLFEPVIADEPGSAPVPTEAPEPDGTGTSPKLEIKQPSPWRKTESFRPENSKDKPVPLHEWITQKPTASPQADDQDSNIWGVCLVTLLEENRLVSGGAEYSMEYQSQQYRFSSEEALVKFRAAPHMYAPAAGGLDVVAVKNGKSIVKGSLNCALWYHRKLYLFSSAEHAEEFRRHPEKYVAAN